jgi:Domain of unknown function (DUF4114)
MKNLNIFGLLAWVAITSSCKKGEALNPIKLDSQTIAVNTPLSDTTVYVYPTGYTESTAIAQPVNLGVPIYLEAKNDIVNPAFLSAIKLLLPSRASIVEKHPDLLAANAVNTINVKSISDIYVTFIDQSTGYNNAIGYYTYKTGHPPVATSGGSANGAMDKVIYIFPNAMTVIKNGGLVTGNKVKLGTFNAGTSIGFVLFRSGWTGTTISASTLKYYSQDSLNPETISNLKKHSIMLYDNSQDIFLVGFEDTDREKTSDNDFNDVMFYISSTVTHGINNTNVVPIYKFENDN